MNSIRHRLLIWQTGALLSAALLVSLVTYQLTWDGFNQVRDFALEQIAQTIVRHVADSDQRNPAAGDPEQFVSQIWNADGSLQYSSRPDLKLPRQSAGNNVVDWHGEEWHTFTIVRGDGTIQVANTGSNREQMFEKISPWLLLPLGLLIGILGVLFWFAVGKALAPLAEVRSELATRDVTDLQPLPPRDYPVEIAPMVATLDQLLLALNQALASQRRFIADAAHELRTPLTAIKLQTQVALASPTDEDRREALAMLRTSVDRATRLVEQLLHLARLGPESRQRKTVAPVELDQLIKQVVAEMSSIADARGIDLGVGQCEPTTIAGDAESLRVLVGNLVDNALRYGRQGGRVDVELRNESDRCVISVTDDGPGIPARERDAVFERFHRLAGAAVPGSGLGLAIVKEIAAQHEGSVTLDDAPGGGLRVSLRLPRGRFPERP